MSTRLRWFLAPASLAALTAVIAVAQTNPVAAPPSAAPVEAGVAADGLVTLNADDILVTQILNAFSRQTGRSIVVGPDVTGRTTVRLTGVPWESALEAVLKPFGYGHYTAGNATVVCGTDTLVSRLFTLKYVDASDVEDVIRSAMSPRGKISKVVARSQSWSASTEGGGSTMAGGNTMGKRQRSQEKSEMAKTKTIVVTDIPAALDQIALLIGEVDRQPLQILIEARFLEASPSVLRDIGVEFGTGADGASVLGFAQGGDAYGAGAQTVSSRVQPGNFTPASGLSINKSSPFNAGLNLMFQKLSPAQFEVLLHMLQENASVNVLSAPRILTLNNQEATIIVGQKYPIIDSNVSTGAGATPTITTSLRGYEDIGIQLNVLPQVCEGRSVNMIVRPSVREWVGEKSGVAAGAGSGETALTMYPVISTREAETQVLVRDGQTIVIGGLLKDKQTRITIKVPILGDIPLLGALFRRQTDQNEKIELLIFLTASIVREGSSLVETNLAAQVSGPFGAPAVSTVVPAVSAAPVVTVTEPIPPVAVKTVEVLVVEPVAATPPVAAETMQVPAVEDPVAAMPTAVVESVPAPAAAPEPEVPVAEVAAPAAPVNAPVVAPPAVVSGSAGDEVARAIESAGAASTAAADKANTIRRELGMGDAAAAPAVSAP